MKYKVDHENWMSASGTTGMAATFFVVSKSLFIFLCRVNKNFVSVFIAKLTNPKSTNKPNGIE